ncbi:hypothetical protein M3D91_011075 [Micrococcus luteus]|nr:hypothetical protein [Micrococcus luteus]
MSAARRLAPMDLLAGLVMEDGRRWGEVAHPFQRADASAVLAQDGPRRHFLLRGRGMSKTTDVAAMTLALLLCEAPERSRSHVYAVDADQAALFADAFAGFVGRTPGLAGAVDVKARTVTVRGTGASLTIETSDGASAYGTRPWLTVVDELSMWPSTQNYRQLWGAIVSAVPKVPGSRLVVIGTAGPPSGLGAEVWESVQAAPSWRTARTPGPSPWWSEADVESTRADLTASDWRRLILCEWAEGDDSLTTPDDVEAAIRGGSTVLEPRPGVQYVAALDVGTRRDLTALAVGHRERRAEGPVVVVDRVLYWRPPAGGRVDLAEVEAVVLRVCRQYRARLRFDRMQAEQMTANLERAGVTVREYVFSAQGANRLARGIHGALRDRALSLPDDVEVRDEFLSTRLVETAPGVVKLSNPRGSHDDIVTAVGMIVADFMERPDDSGARATVPRGVLPPRALGGGFRESGGARGAGLPGMPLGRPGPYGARIPGRGGLGTQSGARWGR